MSSQFLCGRCETIKEESEFHRSTSRGRQAWCKSCRKEYDADYHRRRREIGTRQKYARRRAFIKWYQSLKDGRCVECGGRFHPAAMQWDHLPGVNKLADVGRLSSKNSRRLILEEIAKCELVCANCHAVRTYERRQGGIRSP